MSATGLMRTNIKPIAIFLICLVIAVIWGIGHYIDTGLRGYPRKISNLDKLGRMIGLAFPKDAKIIDAMDRTSLQAASTLAVVQMPRQEVEKFLAQPRLSLYNGTEMVADSWEVETDGRKTVLTQHPVIDRKALAEAPEREGFAIKSWDIGQVQDFRLAGWGENHRPPPGAGTPSSNDYGSLLVNLDNAKFATVYIYFFY